MIHPARLMMAAVLLALVCAGTAQADSGEAHGSAMAPALQNPGHSPWATMTPGALALRPGYDLDAAEAPTLPAEVGPLRPAAFVELEPDPGSEEGGTFGGVSTGGLAIVATGIAAIVLVVLAAGD